MLDSRCRFFYREHGFGFSLEFIHVEPSQVYAEIVPPCWQPVAGPVDCEFEFQIEYADREGVRAYRLMLGGEMLLGTGRLEQFAGPAGKRIHWEVAQASRLEYFIHAGVVAVGGRAILLPGRTFSGKSTLVRDLVQLGATYYSDEYALVTPAPVPMIRSFPRRISLREDMSRDEVAGSYERAALLPEIVLDSIYFLNFEPASEWRTRIVSPGRAALKLFENSLVAQTRPVEMMEALGRLCLPVPSFEGVRGEGLVAAQVLLTEVRGRQSASEVSPQL